MSKNYMLVIIKPPNQKPQVIVIPKKLKNMEKIVGGTVEEVRYEKVLLIYNENQKDDTLKENKLFEDISIKGTVLIAGNDENAGDVRSLSQKELIKYLNKLGYRDKTKEQEKEDE